MIDVIIPCFNVATNLNNVLTSIVNTTSDLSQLNIYVIDDCSNYENDYLDIINKFSDKLNISYSRNAENSGPGFSRNRGINLGHSKFITFIDDDDLVIDDILSYIDSDYDLIVTRYFFADHYVEPVGPINAVQGMIFSRDYMDKYNFRFANIRHGSEDSLLRCAVLLNTNNIKCIYDKTFYKHIINKNSTYSMLYHRINHDHFSVYEYTQYFTLFVTYYKEYLYNKNLNKNTFNILLNILQSVIKEAAALPITNFSIEMYLILIYACILLLDNKNYKYVNTTQSDTVKLAVFIKKYFTVTTDGCIQIKMSDPTIQTYSEYLLNAFDYGLGVVTLDIQSILDIHLRYHYKYIYYKNEEPVHPLVEIFKF